VVRVVWKISANMENAMIERKRRLFLGWLGAAVGGCLIGAFALTLLFGVIWLVFPTLQAPYTDSPLTLSEVLLYGTLIGGYFGLVGGSTHGVVRNFRLTKEKRQWIAFFLATVQGVIAGTILVYALGGTFTGAHLTLVIVVALITGLAIGSFTISGEGK